MASDREFYDAVFEVWRSGGNPDHVDRDRMFYDRADGFEPEVCVEREVRRVLRPLAKKDHEEEAMTETLDVQRWV